MRLPPVLLAHPGSGTTVTSLLIEYATGIFSGSIYDEDELLKLMPGYKACGQRLGIIKAHPKDFVVSAEGDMHPDSKRFMRKCHKGMIYNFNRFLLVLRDPWAAIWSNYQRDYNYVEFFEDSSTLKSHTRGIPYQEFNESQWQDRFLNSVHYGVHAYHRMWNSTYDIITRKYGHGKYNLDNIQESPYHSKRTSRRLHNGEGKSSPPVLIVRYEDLMSNSTKYSLLMDIVKFIDLPFIKSTTVNIDLLDDDPKMDTPRMKVAKEQDTELLRRVICSYTLADNPVIHRNTNPEGLNLEPDETPADVNGMMSFYGKDMRASVEGSNRPNRWTSKADAYSNKDFVCKAWKALQQSEKYLKYFGYYHGPDGSIPKCD
jgi:hypothetical protein